MLVALDASSGTRVEARRDTPGADYFCPGCGAEVVLKRGRVIASHFAHAAQHSCRYALGETAEHLAAKRAFAAAFQARGLACELECEVLSGEGDRRADVLVRQPQTGRPVAIEIQHSPLAVEAIEARTAAYGAAGVAVIWVPTLRPERLPLQRIDGSPLLVCDRYDAPAWQCWAYAYHGALWFFDLSRNAIWRGRLEERWVRDTVHPYTPTDETSPPGWRLASRVRHLLLDGPHHLAEARLRLWQRPFQAHESYRLPGGPAAELVSSYAAPLTRIAWRGTGPIHPVLEVQTDAGWAPVRLVPLAPALPARQAEQKTGRRR